MSEEQVNPILLRFLEAGSSEEKYEILREVGLDITDRLIDDMSASLDLVIPSGPVDERFQKLKNALATRAKYETERFRR